MSLCSAFDQLKDNLRFFRINESEIGDRYRVLVDEAVHYLECEEEEELDEGTLINIGALRQRAWDLIHTGKWSDVQAEDKYLYSVSTYLEVLTQFREHLSATCGDASKSQFFLEHCIESLDMAILLGEPVVNEQGQDVFCLAATILSRLIDPGDCPAIIISPDDLKEDRVMDVPVHDSESLLESTFTCDYYERGQPVLIRNGITQWPAADKWRDVSFFQTNFGYRTVPVEIGSQYTTEDWGQELMLFKDFIETQFRKSPKEGPVQYLAQHDLFRQIPELRKDISRPRLLDALKICPHSIDTKIWFGPEGTVSPLHYDKKENFLCQVIGWKRVVLVRPGDSEFVYPYEGEMMSNTSRLDLTTDIDTEEFPLAARAHRQTVLIGPGEMLFIPYGWWHHVRSLTPSISVSFWWNKTE